MPDHDGHTINIGPTKADRTAIKWCATHDDVAIVYCDGSVSCRWELVVETCTDDHVLLELPEVSQLRAEKEALQAELIAIYDAARKSGTRESLAARQGEQT